MAHRSRRPFGRNPSLPAAAGIAALLAVAASGSDARAQAGDFTLIALPDTQFYTCSSSSTSCASGLGIFADQTAWIAQERDARNIAFVTQLGDCVENGNIAAEWDIADAAFASIEAAVAPHQPDGIPFGIAVGNHDQAPATDPGSIPSVSDVGNPAQGTTTTSYNAYFGVERFCPSGVCRGYYGDHFGINNDNHYELFSVNGYDFIVLHIEYMSASSPLRQAVLDWADAVLTAFPDRRAIVTSHWVLETGFGAPFSNQGSAIYEALKHHPGLFLILGGHVSGEGQRTDVFQGHTVHTLLSDYQSRANGGSGWLRILEFQPSANTISVRTYSPYLDAYETDADSEFVLAYDMQGGYPEAEQARFQAGVDGYAGAVDSYIESGTGAHGGEDHLFWDGSPEKHGLLRFEGLFDVDGGPIPAGAAIVSATLRYVADDDGNPANVHEVAIDWDETTTYDSFGSESPTPIPGPQPDSDYDSTPLAEQASGAAPGAVATAHSLDVTSSLAAWSADPSRNHGWIFVPTGSSGTGIRTREHAGVSDRPLLTVTYLPEPCTTDAECADSRLCTADACVAGFCQNAPIAGCCEADADCDDADACTADACDLESNSCEHAVDPICCSDDADCSDGDACSVEACILPNPAALSFDGSGDHVSFGAASTHTELGLSRFTVEAWFRRTGAGVAVSTGTGGVSAVPIVSKGQSEADGNNRDANYFFGISGNVLAADFEDTGGSPNNHPVVGTTPLALGVWYHGAVTFDGAELRLYLDGNLDGSIATSTTPRFDSIQPFGIGTSFESSGLAEGFFQGQIDEVRVWNRALTAAELQAQRHQPLLAGSGLVGRFGLDEGSGTSVGDSVAGNGGSLVGDTLWTTSDLVDMGSGACSSTPVPLCCEVDGDCNDADLCGVDACHAVAPSGVLAFDGIDDYIGKIDDPPSLGSATFTLEAWIFWDGGGATSSSGTGGIVAVPVIAKGRGEADGNNRDANYFLGISLANGNVLAADFEDTGPSPNNHPVLGATPVTTGEWHHVAATYDGGSWALYLDGGLEAQELEGATPRFDSIQDFGIGGALNSNGVREGSFDGLIHQVRVWDHARTLAEIQAAMNLEITSAAGLLGSWPLAEGTGAVATDATGNGNHGTVFGATWTSASNACVPGPDVCPRVMLQQDFEGYAATVDTTLEIGLGAQGALDHVRWDGDPARFGLIRFEGLFDVEGGPIPLGATIVEATLRYVVDDDGNPANVHEVAIDWDESVDYAGFGAAPGAQAGADYSAAALPGTAPGALVGTSTPYSFDVTQSVAAWAGDPGLNRGWIFVPTGGSGVSFLSSEHATAADRPKLSIKYLPPECTIAADCDDGDACSTDLCLAGSCYHATPRFCDVDGDGWVDVHDIALIVVARNTSSGGVCDPLDANGDGAITVLDASVCRLECDNPECAEHVPACGLLGLEPALALWILAARRRRKQEARHA